MSDTVIVNVLERFEAFSRKLRTGLSCADKTSDTNPLKNCITIITQYFESGSTRQVFCGDIYVKYPHTSVGRLRNETHFFVKVYMYMYTDFCSN